MKRRLLLDRDVPDPGTVCPLVVDPVQVAVDQRPHRQERLPLHGLPLTTQLGRGGRPQDVGGPADRAPLDALELALGIEAVRLAGALGLGATVAMPGRVAGP